jgi:hypothetical protein
LVIGLLTDDTDLFYRMDRINGIELEEHEVIPVSEVYSGATHFSLMK